MSKHVLVLFVCLLCVISTSAIDLQKVSTQDSTEVVKPKKPTRSGFRRFLDAITAIDTNYIIPNKYHASAMLLGEKRFSFYSLRSKNEKNEVQELSFSPRSPIKVGPYVGFSLLFLGYTFNVGSQQSSLNRSNLYLSLYSKMFGIDYYYEADAHNYRLVGASGFGSETDNKINDISFSGMSTYFMNLHIYYLFNNKRFSYPAAYSQSTVQKRSCGSFTLGFNYTREKVFFDYTKLPQILLYDENGNELLEENLKVNKVTYRNYSMSIGYAYNWAFAKNCLANLTVAPTLGYNFSDGEKFDTKEKLFNLDALNFDLISRASIVWNNTKFFAGISGVAHTYTYKKPLFSVHNSVITLSLYSGLYLMKKKAYKNKNGRKSTR